MLWTSLLTADNLPDMTGKTNWDQYHEYEGLDKILTAQKMRSAEEGNPVHDEMLFIIFHQVYELWFKQILFELDDIQRRFSSNVVDDRDMQPILTYLGRIEKIFRNLVGMMDVLETMPPQSFLDFRRYLGTASGFQSWQVRLIELRLGLRREDRIPVFGGEFDEDLRAESRKAFNDAEGSASLYDQIDTWLSRTPFVDWQDYKFTEEYRQAVHNMLDQSAQHGVSADDITRGKAKFESIFDADKHDQAIKDGLWRMSAPALQAALFITIYREEPVLQGPYRLLQHIIDVDALIAQWRYRHALLVQRMVGMGAGTGGSSGYNYLMDTVQKHRIFNDLFSLSSYIIPSDALPALPQQLKDTMTYGYTKAA
ncbi:MAG: tryptophan 2,3-dioxygenase family protein [Pseudomonadota bacterium]|nr:tryptophan 2,3-dioxygenase family protein [Pseudomonadota bacterium]